MERGSWLYHLAGDRIPAALPNGQVAIYEGDRADGLRSLQPHTEGVKVVRPYATQRTSTAPVGRQARIAVADVCIERGIAYDQLCQIERAIGDGDAAIRINPHYAKAYSFLSIKICADSGHDQLFQLRGHPGIGLIMNRLVWWRD